MRKRIFVVIFSILTLCGCGELNGEFYALNLGKVSAIYENGALKIDSRESPFALFFFTTTCGVCKAQIPILQEIANESQIKIYGILGNAKSAEIAQSYAVTNKVSLPIFYEISARRFFTQIVGGVKGVPVVAVFDKNGKMKAKFIGLTPKSVLKGAL